MQLRPAPDTPGDCTLHMLYFEHKHCKLNLGRTLYVSVKSVTCTLTHTVSLYVRDMHSHIQWNCVSESACERWCLCCSCKKPKVQLRTAASAAAALNDLAMQDEFQNHPFQQQMRQNYTVVLVLGRGTTISSLNAARDA